LYVGAAIFGGQALYLYALASSHDWLAAIPKAPPVTPSLYQSDLYIPPPWYWGDAVRTLLPWGLPWTALLIHAMTAAAMLRWSRWSSDGESPGSSRQAVLPSDAQRDEAFARLPATLGLGAIALAAIFALVTSLSTGSFELTGRKVVVYEHGSLDWEKPKFDQYGRESAGQYGMLPMFLSSLGAQFTRTTELASPAVDAADVLVVIHPTRPWSAEQTERVWAYVRQGRALLVLAQPRVQDERSASSFNELLEAINVEVRFDTAVAATRNWQHGLESAIHPAVAGIDGSSNGFSLAESSSIRLGWQGRPLLVGRWGWSDPGSDAVLTGVTRLDAGARLGDLVLAAEQGVGQGSVVVLADANPLKNLGLPSGYEFTGRLLAYLASRGSSPAAGWRQAVGLLAGLGLVWMLGWKASPGRLAASLGVLALLLAMSNALATDRTKTFLDGKTSTPNPVVCIDTSHLPQASGELWSDDGLAGLQLTLMRNGYLPIVLRRWDDEQLHRAGMLIAIAPARPFAGSEIADVRRFLEQGGVMLCMAGANHAGPIQPLLREFGLSVPLSPVAANDPRSEPSPMGFFRTPYLDSGKYKSYMGLYAGWPVATEGQGADAFVRGFGDLPVVGVAHVGRGSLYVFGDTYFAANKNLESEDSKAARGLRENAYFWRWFLGELNGPKWTPPELPEEPAATDDDSPDDDTAEKPPKAGAMQQAGPKRSPGKEARP